MRFRFASNSLSILILLGVALSGCKNATSNLPVVQMKVGSEKFTLEIARTEEEQKHGLMERDGLDSDHGMIFPSKYAKVQVYWNHHVHFPLDLVFLDEHATIVAIKNMPAYSEANVSSVVEAKYVIELLGGTVARAHIEVGQKLELPDVIASGTWPR